MLLLAVSSPAQLSLLFVLSALSFLYYAYYLLIKKPATLIDIQLKLYIFDLQGFADCSVYYGTRDIKPVVHAQQANRKPQKGHEMVLAAKSLHNEIELVNHFLYWYLHQGFRRYVLVDNESNDGTLQELVQFGEQYRHTVELALISQHQHIFYPRSLEPAAQLLAYNLWPDAQWVFVVDVDEFVVSANGLGIDFNSIPENINQIECLCEQYCPVKHYSPDENDEFYDRLPYLSTKSSKQKVIRRNDFEYKPFIGHHKYLQRINSRCENLLTAPLTSMNVQQFNGYLQCTDYYRNGWRAGERQCTLNDVVLATVPVNPLLQGNYEVQTHETNKKILNFNIQQRLTVSNLIYDMYKMYVSSGECPQFSSNSSFEVSSIFKPPGLLYRWSLDGWDTSDGLSFDQLMCRYLKVFSFSDQDMTLVIYFPDSEVQAYNTLKWHFAIGFRRFIVLTTEINSKQLKQVKQFNDETKNFAQVSYLALPESAKNKQYNQLMEIASHFVTGIQHSIQNSLITFFIQSNQLIIPNGRSLYQSIVQARHDSSQQCHAFTTQVADCQLTQNSGSVECGKGQIIGAHQALLYSEYHYFQLQYGLVQWKNSDFISISANATALQQRLKKHNMGKINKADCKSYNISFREYPNRSQKQFVSKYLNGYSFKYREVRGYLQLFRGTMAEKLKTVYNFWLLDPQNSYYDPLPLKDAIQTAKQLRQTGSADAGVENTALG